MHGIPRNVRSRAIRSAPPSSLDVRLEATGCPTANPPSLQTVRHAIRTAAGTQEVIARILSLPLYAVEALPRLLQKLRVDAGTRRSRES